MRTHANAVVPTDDQIALIRTLRAGGMAWDKMSPILGMSKSWCQGAALRHGFGASFSKQAPALRTTCDIRAAAGSAPLPAFHPIAMAELRRAREVAL